MIFVCSICGTQAAEDSRTGSVAHYLACGCADKGIWVNDGRGGFWQPLSNARCVSLEEYLNGKK